MSIDYEILPQHLRQEALQYIQNGTQPGELMTAVIENDLAVALGLVREMEATEQHFEGFASMSAMGEFLATEAPPDCSGSAAISAAWMCKETPQERSPLGRLRAECCDFKETAARIQIKLFLDGAELVTFAIARRHTADVVRLINGL